MLPIFLSPRELAQRLNVSYETVLKWAKLGKIPFIRDDRGRYLFNLNAVANAICFDGAPERVKALACARTDARRKAAVREGA